MIGASRRASSHDEIDETRVFLDLRFVEVAHPIVRRADTTVVEYVVDLDDDQA